MTAPQAEMDSPWFARAEWLLVLGLAAMLAWTTLCLGGYLAQTMIATAWAIAGISVLGGVLWFARAPQLHWATLLPLPFLIYALGSTLWLAPAKWIAWREWLLWFQMWLVFVLALHFGRSRNHTWVFVSTFVLLGLTGVAMAAYQRYVDSSWMMLGREQASQFYGRSAGMFGIPNSLAGLLELMVPVCLTLMLSRATNATGKLLCGWLAGLFVFAVVLTGSRGGWIGLSGALLLWPLLAGREWRRKLAGVAIVAVIAIGGVGALYRFSEPARDRIQPFLEGKFESSRPIMWKAAAKIWSDHKLIGSGAASYNVVFDQYRPRGFNNEPDWTHNDYLNTLSDYGVLGFALWAAAGAALLILGWRTVQRARRDPAANAGVFTRAKWKLGLLLGLIAYALHLSVDFHTKIPALAFAAAIVMAVLIRDESRWLFAPSKQLKLSAVILVGVVPIVLCALLTNPLYRAEALRYAARRDIDRNVETGKGDGGKIIPSSQASFERAVALYPENAQAWADLSYVTVLSWHVGERKALKELGQRAEIAANRALELCPVDAEYWVRKGVALDMQARHAAAETCFKRALELAPNSPEWYYNYAYHLSVRPGRTAEALRAVEACLALDPSISAGVALHQQLTTRR